MNSTHRGRLSQMGRFRVRLYEFLQEHDLSAYKLANCFPRTREDAIYRMARKEEDMRPTRIDLFILGSVVDYLSQLTGRDVAVGEILEYVKE